MYCKHCGNKIKDNNKICPFCLTNINNSSDNKNSSTFCTSCGNYLDKNIAICPKCGVPLSKNKIISNSDKLIATLLGFLFPLIAVICYFLIRDDKPELSSFILKGAIAGFLFEFIITLTVTGFWVTIMLLIMRIGAGLS